MRQLLASAAALIALFVSAQALAAPVDLEGTGRCVEQPMSLSMRIAEVESSRALPEADLASNADPVNATPGAVARPAVLNNGNGNAVAAPSRPVSMPPRACNSSDDPGCQVSSPVQAPTHVQAGHVDHGFALAPFAPELPPVDVVMLYWPASAGRALEGFVLDVLRPPQA